MDRDLIYQDAVKCVGDASHCVQEIISREWDMFQRVHNEGGRASCQDDHETFVIMRESQFVIWSEEALSSYLDDLREAELAGRNLLTEKYGYMMEETAPGEYETIREAFPEVSAKKRELVEQLVKEEVLWREAFNRAYPDYGKYGRPLRREDAGCGETSVETYARGELKTYSERTLELLADQYRKLEETGENPAVRIMDYTARQYGYQDSADAQKRLSGRG